MLIDEDFVEVVDTRSNNIQPRATAKQTWPLDVCRRRPLTHTFWREGLDIAEWLDELKSRACTC